MQRRDRNGLRLAYLLEHGQSKVKLLVQRPLLELIQNKDDPAELLARTRVERRGCRSDDTRGWECVVNVVVVVNRESQLLEVVLTLDSSCRLASCLDGRQEQRNQNTDDRNDDQQLDQRES